MNKARHAKQEALLAEAEAVLADIQPCLKVVERAPKIVIEGPFLLRSSDGPFDQFEIRIVTTGRFPEQEPAVFETGKRIPRCIDRHINTKGDCCLTVWEEWLVTAPDTSFRGFLEGPVHEFFLSQWWFEKKGHWRFGDRSHFAPGLVEAYASVLDVPVKQETVLRYLRALSKEWPKGHWPCPCGSNKKLRHCHRDRLYELHQRVPPKIARRMFQRLREALEAQRKVRRGN